MSTNPFRRLFKRLKRTKITGISTPFGGVTVEHPALERETAEKLLTFLDDRRVINEWIYIEHINACYKSVQAIRQRITADLEKTDRTTFFGETLISMQVACRNLLNIIEHSVREHFGESGDLYRLADRMFESGIRSRLAYDSLTFRFEELNEEQTQVISHLIDSFLSMRYVFYQAILDIVQHFNVDISAYGALSQSLIKYQESRD